MSDNKNAINTDKLSWRVDSIWNKATDNTPLARKGREKVIQDYFNLYVESGIMNYFAQKVRDEFEIPNLEPKTDLTLVILLENESSATEEEKSYWYEELSQAKRKELDNRIKEIMKQLYLPGSSFRLLLNYFLYEGKIKSLTPMFDEYLIECIAFGNYPKDEMLGYKKTEIPNLQQQALFYLKHIQREKILVSDLTDEEKKEELRWVDKQIESVPLRCEEILKYFEREKRPLRTLEEDIQVIKKLKDYKIHHEEFDPLVRLTSKWKITSQYIMEELYPEMPTKKLKKAANNFRKHVERLIKKYPFLPDFIASKKFKF